MDTMFNSALERVIEVIMFENWLRFYFIEEDDDDALYIRLPEKTLQRLATEYPKLVGLAESLNNEEIDHQRSVDAVCLFVAKELDGRAIPEATMQKVFDASAFQFELSLFGNWVQNHEKQLDEVFMPFAQWQKIYADWKKTETVQKYIVEMEEASGRISTTPITTTQ